MTQQINLYQPEPRPSLRPLLVPVIGLLLFASMMVFYAEVLRSQNQQLRAEVAQLASQAKSEKAMLAIEKAKLGERQAEGDLDVEMAAVKAAATDAQALVARIEAGELGTLHGFAGHLTALARIPEEGLWVTGVHIQKGGRSVSVEGRSLRSDTVLKYVEHLNRQMSPFGAQITGLELTPVAAPAGLSAMAFKLY